MSIRTVAVAAIVAAGLAAGCQDQAAATDTPAPEASAAADVATSAEAPAQASAAVEEEAAVQAVVASIYDTYVADVGSGARIPDGVETRGLRAAIAAASDPDMGGLGFDYYCACQDYGDVSYEMSGVAIDDDRATVAVDFRSFGQLTQMELRLLKEGGRWRVDDVIDPNGSLRAQLASN